MAADRAAVATAAANRLVAAHAVATGYYREQLRGAGGAGPLHYLHQRGVTDVLDDPRWAVGYAPSGWTGLVDQLRATGFTGAEMEASGLALRTRRGTLVDRFRDRVMFGVREAREPRRGEVVGFIGRAAPGNTDPRAPKYLNSPASAVYDKSSLLFGLAEARKQPGGRGAGQPVIVEGAFDVLAMADLGFAVAPSGTALTAAQVSVLRSCCEPTDGVLVAFDGDAAGRAAAVRAYGVLAGYGGPLYAAMLPAGLDPADYRRPGGPGVDALWEVTNRRDRQVPLARLVVEDRLDQLAPLRWAEQRVAALRSVAPLVAAQSAEQIGDLVVHLATRLDLHHASVSGAVADAITAAPTRAPAATTRRRDGPSRGGGIAGLAHGLRADAERKARELRGEDQAVGTRGQVPATELSAGRPHGRDASSLAEWQWERHAGAQDLYAGLEL